MNDRLLTSRLLKQFGAFLLGGFLFTQAHAQNFEWAVQMSGTGDDFGTSVDTDVNGNVFSTGFFFGDCDFDPGAGNFILTSAGQQDIFVTKLDVNGNFLWANSYGSTLRDRANAVVVDNDQNVFVTGYFEGTVDFDPANPGVQLLTSVGDRDVFILKLDTDGNFLWVNHFESTDFSEALGMKLNRDGNLVLVGTFRGTSTFDPPLATIQHTSAGLRDIFITEIDTDGNIQWLTRISGAGDGYGYSIDTDKFGNVYTTGFYTTTMDFNPDGAPEVRTAEGIRDPFILKLNSAGVFQWVTVFGGNGDGRGNGIAADETGVFVGGMFTLNLVFDPGVGANTATSGGGFDMFVAKLDTNGNLLLSNTYSSPQNTLCQAIAKDNLGRMYVSGYYRQTVNFDPVTGPFNLTSSTAQDGFLLQLASNGDFINARSYQASNPFSIQVADNWDVHTTGYFSGTGDMDLDAGTFNLTSANANAVFVQKLNGNCTPPDAPTLLEQANDICPGATAVIDVTAGNLNDATDWAWYDDPYFINQVGTGVQLSIALSDTTTFYVRGEGACVVGTSSITINVGDTTPPVITTSPITLSTEPGACYFISENLPLPVITDNCVIDTVYNDAPLLLFPGVHTITWTAIDESGNMTQETQVVTIEDQENPTIDAPANITASADVNCEVTGLSLGTPVAFDNCTVDNITNDAPATFPLGITTVTWTVTDPAGNIGTDIQTITVVDDTQPTIVGLPANSSTSVDPGNCSAVVNWVEPTASDNCPGVVIIQTSGLANGSAFPVGTSVVEYTATDAAGNNVSASFTVTVIDDENPTITAPANVVVSANNFCTAIGVALGTPVTGDNCGVQSVTNDAPAIYPLGVTVVTWTVTDNAGNTAQTTQQVTVEDNQNPTIIAPADMTVNNDAGVCEATIANLGTPVTDDNCSVASVTNDAPPVFPVGVTIVTWTVEDGSGNLATATQTITVNDVTLPTIVGLPANSSTSVDPGNCSAVINWVEPTASDNCPGVVIIQTSGLANGSAFPVGTSVVEYTATDAAGNNVSASFTVTVIDDESPIVTAPSDTIIEANQFCSAINVVLDTPIATDNCGIASVTNNAPVIFSEGPTLVTWIVTDLSGNSVSVNQLVTVNDSTAPTLIAPLPVFAFVGDSCDVLSSSITLGTPTVFDNCAIDTVFHDAPDTLTTGDYIITWTAIDMAGNSGTITQQLIVQDTISPVAVLNDTTITLTTGGPILLSGVDIDNGSTDNCGVASVTLEQTSFDCDDLGVNTIGVQVLDVNGNVTYSTITVTVLPSGIDLDFDGIDDACDDAVNTTVVEIPTGFTPNGDGINDLFVITSLDDFTQRELYIYNRYGNLVYESGMYENDWNGTSSKNGMELPDGTYYYVLILNGEAERNGYVYINRTR